MTGHDDLPLETRGQATPCGRLAGRRILVVGAGTRASDDPDPPIGNGRAMAILAAREGAKVAAADVDPAAVQGTLDWLTREGHEAVALVGDVADAATCERLIAEAAARLGGLDGLVLNVGIAGGMNLEGTTPEIWDHVFAVNLRSHFLLARAALPRMPAGGAIVFVSSVAGIRPGSRIPAYDTSKAGMFALCRHVALEGARQRVRANVVVPGLIDTPLGRLATAMRPGRAQTPVPLGRQGTGWEVAYATLFLLSNEASYVTGQELVVDGGLVFQAG